MDKATLIKRLRTCASNGTNCQKCPMFLVCVLQGKRLTQLAADMLEEDAQQLAYADDTVQTLLHEQKQTMLNLVSISLPNVTGNDHYAAGFNAALAQVRSAVQAWDFAYRNGRSDTK